MAEVVEDNFHLFQPVTAVPRRPTAQQLDKLIMRLKHTKNTNVSTDRNKK